MNKYFFSIVLSILVITLSKTSKASEGDTIKVKTHDLVHMNVNGNYDRYGIFPTSSKTFQRIWLKYTLGCPDNGCSEWDYTTKIFIRQRTGVNDSTLKQAPFFKIANQIKDTIKVSLSPTYDLVFNQTLKKVDTIFRASQLLVFYRNINFPITATDTMIVWPANFYKYSFDTAGIKTDSSLTPFDTMFIQSYTPYYSVFEAVNNYEIARVITPYAGGYTKTWKNEFWFDITDYASLLNDSVEIRANYGGYQDGFAISLDFYMVEGKAPKTVSSIVNLWNGSFAYGNVNNPIENQLKEKRVKVPADAVSANFIVIPTGHGFGGSDGCAEFCSKKFFIKVNDSQIVEEAIWRNNCGLNSHYPQPGTWLYDRANWCPGAAVKTFSYPVQVQNNDSLKLLFGIEPYVNQGNSNTSYNIATHIIFYKAENNYTLDLSVEDIISPSKEFRHNRSNPGCNNAKIKLKNLGRASINSVSFLVSVENQAAQKIEWSGNIVSEGEQEIIFPWVNWAGAKADGLFSVTIDKVNGVKDENSFNNIKTSTFDMPLVAPGKIIIETKTNNYPAQSRLKVVNTEGTVFIDRTFTAVSTIHRDTLELGFGCYNLLFTDEQGDGLDFWANRSDAGTGFFRVMKAEPYSTLKTFKADFGSSIVFNFMVNGALGTEKLENENQGNLYLFPNPANKVLYVESEFDKKEIIDFEIYDGLGRKLAVKSNNGEISEFDVSELDAGVYFLVSRNSNRSIVNKFLIYR